MKVCICTTPIRPTPTDFPPFGSLAIIQALRKIDVHAEFYNIDYFRPPRDEVKRFFQEKQFDVLGISAVVSTAYAYTKWLVNTVKSVSPQTLIIVGGNMGASAEILLRKASVDICVAGDGELIIQELVNAIKKRPSDLKAELAKIKGLAFLDRDGEFRFTGYGMKPAADDIEFPDFSILEKDGSLKHFLGEKLDIRGNPQNPVMKIETTVTASKGCVATCTFCHRWEKGYRARPADTIIGHIKFLIEKYGVNHIVFSDENFGANRELTRDLARQLGELHITWVVAGVRARTVMPDDLKLWRENGCVAAYFGIETGSDKMLKVMEKNATVEDNVNSMKWVGEAGIQTIIQLVVGMPGETDETIEETIEYLKEISPYVIRWKHTNPGGGISINYAQALPGTPLYEYAREIGFIGKTIEEEENYLLKISDTDAYSHDHFINYTGLPLLKVLSWRQLICARVDAHYAREVRKVGDYSLYQVVRFYAGVAWQRLRKSMSWIASKDVTPKDNDEHRGYFNIQQFSWTPMLLNNISKRAFIPVVMIYAAVKGGKTISNTAWLLIEFILWKLKILKLQAPQQLESKSLRKINKISTSKEAGNYGEMLPLRLGR